MKKIFYLTFVLLPMFINNANSQSQTIVTKKWASCIGRPDTVNWASSAFDSYGCLTVTGSKYIGSNNTDVFVVKYDISGNIMWQTTYNGTSNGLDYGVAIVAGTNGDVYVAAATTTVGSGLDMAILKYSNTGILTWAAKWTGTGSFNDVPSCIAVNSVGDIYIAGSTYAAATLYNYALIKYNSSGTKLWQSTYDYTAKTDFVTAMVINSAGDVIVTGSSAATTTNWDFTTLKYAGSNGALLNTKRINVAGHGQDVAAAIAKDDSDNIIITGYTYANSNYDIQTAKLSSTLVSKWTKTFDGQGLDDAAYDIGVDILGNIFITGQTRKLNNGIDFITKKYNRGGTELWSNRYQADDETKYAKASKLFVESNGKVIIVGTADRINNSDILAVEYDSLGDIKWGRYFNGSGDTNDMALSVKCNNSGSVYITGMSRDTYDTMRYATIKYDYDILDKIVVKDSLTDTSKYTVYMKDQLMISFKPEIINTAIVDNKEWQWGMLNDVILDSNYSNMIYEKLGLGTNYETGLKIYKVYTGMTTADSISISRLGDTVKMESLWSTFLLAIPSSLGVLPARDSLSLLDTIIEYADPNYVYMLCDVPQDSYIDEQASLVTNSAHPLANINMDVAWDIEAGQSYIRVGVLDNAIHWANEDFGDGSYTNSKIKGGKNYDNGLDISQITTGDPHGTAVAGIIGAIRNNTNASHTAVIGVAGIAGADVDNNKGTGVELYSLVMCTAKGSVFDDAKAANAIVEGASNTTNNYGYALHIMNASWGGPDKGKSVSAALQTCYKNNCAFFASRGNYYSNAADNFNNNVKAVDEKWYPACTENMGVFNIGASGNEGTHKFATVNGDVTYESMYDHGVDVIAPGSLDIVLTTASPSGQFTSPAFTDLSYTRFSGTSAAAPHAAGVAALMMSKHNTVNGYPNNLDPEDIRFMFRSNSYTDDIATTVNGVTYASGYDKYNGWGRINAGRLLQFVNLDNGYYIQHISKPTRTVSTSTTLNTNLHLTETVNSYPAGYYDGYLSTVTDVYTCQVTSTASQLIENWPRNYLNTAGVNTIGTGLGNDISNTSYYSLYMSISGTTATITKVTYCWLLTNSHYTGTMYNWIPIFPNNVAEDWSLHIHDPSYNSVAEKTTKGDLTIYPNPSSNLGNISYALNYEPKTINIDVYDLTGRFVTHIQAPKNNTGTISFDVSEWCAGLYVINIKTDRETLVRKFVKN